MSDTKFTPFAIVPTSDTIKASPRNEALYQLGAGVGSIRDNIPLGNSLIGQVPEALKDWSYEGSSGPIRGGSLQTATPDPRIVDFLNAASNVAAVGGPMKMIKAAVKR